MNSEDLKENIKSLLPNKDREELDFLIDDLIEISKSDSDISHIIKWLEENENYKPDIIVILQAPTPFVKPDQIKMVVDKLLSSNLTIYTLYKI